MHSRIGVFAVAHDLSFTSSKIFKRDHKLHFHYPLLWADLSSSRLYIVTPQQQAVSATYGWRKINPKGNSKALWLTSICPLAAWINPSRISHSFVKPVWKGMGGLVVSWLVVVVIQPAPFKWSNPCLILRIGRGFSDSPKDNCSYLPFLQSRWNHTI